MMDTVYRLPIQYRGQQVGLWLKPADLAERSLATWSHAVFIAWVNSCNDHDSTINIGIGIDIRIIIIICSSHVTTDKTKRDILAGEQPEKQS